MENLKMACKPDDVSLLADGGVEINFDWKWRNTALRAIKDTIQRESVYI